jgi:hypothetical protein
MPSRRIDEMTDRLSLADAKIDRPAAGRIATEIFDAIHDSVATKADVSAVKADVQALKSDLREVELRLEARIDRVVVRLGTPVVALAGLIVAAIRYLPLVH